MFVIIKILLVLDFLGIELNFEATVSNIACCSDKCSFLKNTSSMTNTYKLAS